VCCTACHTLADNGGSGNAGILPLSILDIVVFVTGMEVGYMVRQPASRAQNKGTRSPDILISSTSNPSTITRVLLYRREGLVWLPYPSFCVLTHPPSTHKDQQPSCIQDIVFIQDVIYGEIQVY
jgi:hypothetical protein